MFTPRKHAASIPEEEQYLALFAVCALHGLLSDRSECG